VVQGFKKKARYTFSITWKKTNELIGEISLHLLKDHRGEIGYWIGEPLWNQGIGTEAVGAVIKFGIEQLQLQEITASCKADNIASSKVLIKNGMKETVRTGQLIQYHLKPNS
jgi:ribosomal-protein-alanine N-acetyltransferase